MLSNTCKYAIRALIYLALNEKENEKTGIKKISKDLKIPSPFLGKILQVLAKNKILSSTKGPNGGFGLGKPADNISLMDIVNVIDGSDHLNSCLIGLGTCSEEKITCSVHDQYSSIKEDLKQLLDNQTLATLVSKIRLNHDKIII